MIKVITFCALVLTVLSCKKIDELTKFEMDVNTKFTIESSSSINLPFNVLSPDVETNAEQTFAINDTRKDLIQEIKLLKLELNIDVPNNGDFSFLESIEVFINAANQEEIKLAYKYDIDDNTTESLLALEINSADIKEYIKQDEFDLRVKCITDEIITQDYQIAVNSRFFVDAKIK